MIIKIIVTAIAFSLSGAFSRILYEEYKRRKNK